MSNSILPHLLSDSPPPLVADDEEFDDEFGDFKGSEELSFDNENPSTPSSLKNSNDYFPDSYTDFNLSNVEGRYQIIGPTEDKSTTNIINSIPSSNYFTLWEQIENNIPEIIDKEEDLHNTKETVDNIENGKEINNLSNNQSNEDLHDSNYHEKETDFENQVPFKSTEECSEEITETPNYLELANSLKQNVDCDRLKQLNEDIPSEIKSVNQNQAKNNGESISNDLAPTENNSFSVFHSETEECDDSSFEERTKIDDFSFISDHSVHEEIPSIHSQKAVAEESINVKELDSKNSNVLEEVQASQNMAVRIVENQESEDEFGEFADFSSSKNNNIPILETKSNSVDNDENEDDFQDFGSYQISSVAKIDVDLSKSCDATEDHTESKRNVNTEVIDGFDDFASYSEHDQNTSEEVLKICKTPEEALKKAEIVLEKIFPTIECTTPDYTNCEYIMNNSVFENLKDITETNALTYQWCKSVAQKNILRTLNIDIRNILYGPTWNSGMPIFAPNLCSKPLEPTKSELPIPMSPQKIVESQESTTSTMPQFDWSGSGLTDLQDSSVNVEKEFHTNLQTPNEEFEVIQPTYIDSVPISTKLNHFEEELSQSRQLEGINKVKEYEEINDDFSDFTSYQGSLEKETTWKNMLPLRESHISTNAGQDNLETDKISIYFQELTMGKTEAVGFDRLKTDTTISSNDSSLKLCEKEQQYPAELPFVFNDSKKIKPRTKLEQLTSQNHPLNVKLETDVSNYCDMSVDNFSSFETEEIKRIEEDRIFDQTATKHQEDEFTDFQSSLPCPPKPYIQPALLEPLKPALLKPQPMKDKAVKIEWPEPGLDEEEINRIVNGVLRKNSTSENLMKKLNNTAPSENKPNKPIQKNDHDDWSDFISVKEPLKSRTSTPDLPLSVFNLGSIQPNKASAPFVDPNGVVHSPSKTPSVGFPVINRKLQNDVQQHTHRQPFITSQAFDALYSNTKNSILMPSTSRKTVDIKQSVTPFSYEDKRSIGANRSEQNTSGRNHKDHHEFSGTYSNAEDDDWGDFVSAPNTISHSNSSANFFQPLSYMKTNLGYGSKTAPTQTFETVTKNTVVKQKRNNFPVISTMPDLDFVSPKSRSTIK